ncbi:type IV toxin-antitoxin system AbiEi family antitoxin domain-containing protein [Actinoplanes couchii]|nr:type IV toxin-antitoxin system AbiEi family antitoxin domain-containing protein [Actinoplanes couchii]MDR6316143.1 putative transcriptional regulator of viral defense system [Actinoplanes couchii]
MDARRLAILAAMAEQQAGLFSTAQAGAGGITRPALGRLAQAGVITPLRRGIYVLRGNTPGLLDLRAVWLAADPARDPGAEPLDGPVLSHAAAAQVWGAGDLPAWPVDLTVAHRRWSRQQDVRFRVRDLDPADVTVVDGLPVTGPGRTVADLLEDRFGGHDPAHVGKVAADLLAARRDSFAGLSRHLHAKGGRLGLPGADPGPLVLTALLKAAGYDGAAA